MSDAPVPNADSPCPEIELTSAFLDGELTEADAAGAEAHIAACAECQAFVAVAADVSEAMRRPSARLKAPPLLRARIRRRLDSEASVRPARAGFLWGALSGAGVSAAAAAFIAVLMLPPAPESLAGAVTDAHIHALSAGRTIEVVSSSHHTVKPWFAGRAPLSPPVAEFAAQGFPLVGGRVDRVLGQKAAVVVYGHGKHEIDLFVWADRGAALPASGVRLGYHTVFWKNADLDFAAVSDVAPDELSQFVRLVQAEPE
ncbi:MAG TPA: zf-HC2 domain-containing protein [Caulobacteraceae bacterium]|jgi:anti-sigma factor RsiW